MGKEFEWELLHGKCRGKNTKVAQLIFPAVQKITGKEDYSIPWFEESHKFYKRLGEMDVIILLKKNVPYNYVRWIVMGVGDTQRQRVLEAIKSGKNKAPWKIPQTKRKHEPHIETKSKHGPHIAEMERSITITPPLDEEKLLNLFRSARRFAVLGGLALDDVDKCYEEARRMG